MNWEVCGEKTPQKNNQKKKNKKMLKALQKSFSKSVRQMMMKRANSAASWCSAFYFIQFVQFFIGEKKVLSSLKPTLHKQLALKTSEHTQGEKKGMSASEKSALLERESEQLYSGCSEGHGACQSSLQSVIFS